MKTCPHCGKELPQEMQFCPYCMEKLMVETAAGAPPLRRRRWLWPVMALLLVLCLCGLWLWRPWGRPAPTGAGSSPPPRDGTTTTVTTDTATTTTVTTDTATTTTATTDTATTTMVTTTTAEFAAASTTAIAPDSAPTTTGSVAALRTTTSAVTASSLPTASDGVTTAPTALCEQGHSWESLTKTVQVDEVGHYETQKVVKRVTVFRCALCYQEHLALEDYYAHFDAKHSGDALQGVFRDQYTAEAEYREVEEKTWVVDTPAYDKTVTVGRRCRVCGKTETDDKE